MKNQFIIKESIVEYNVFQLISTISKAFLLFLFFAIICFPVFSQGVAINAAGEPPDVSAILDVKSTNKGLLIPRVKLSATNSNSPIGSDITISLLVYNTETAGTSPNNVIPGYYYWNGTQWLPLLGTDNQNIQGCGLNGTNLTIGIENGNSQIVNLSALQGTDNQNLTGATLIGTNLTIDIENGNSTSVDLATLQDGTGTDNQNIQGCGLNGTNLTIGIENGNSQIVNLAALQGGDAWELLGNSGTDPSTNFLGTTDNKEFSIRTNNTERIRITNKGQIETMNTGFSVFIGEQAGENDNLSDHKNVAIGYQALFSNSYHDDNTAIGYKALYTNTRSQNTAIGSQALYSNLYGTDNTSIGYKALYSNTNGLRNTAIGSEVLNSNTTGYDNVAIGYQALYSNTTGNDNIAIGQKALYSNTASRNIAIGCQALYSNTTGKGNTGIGEYALNENTTGVDNTAIGKYALHYNISGKNNTANGYFALYQNTAGEHNTAIGFLALNNITTGTHNTGVGAHSFLSAPSGCVNSTALGYGATIAASNEVRIGNNSVTKIGGQVGWTSSSDGRIKENIIENVSGIDFIMKLRPVTFNFNKDKQDQILNIVDSCEYAEKYAIEKIKYSGFIAQEVEQAALEAGYDFSAVKKPANENDIYGLTYSEFVVPLVKAMQEQQEEINALEEQNKILQQQNLEILKRLEQIEK